MVRQEGERPWERACERGLVTASSEGFSADLDFGWYVFLPAESDDVGSGGVWGFGADDVQAVYIVTCDVVMHSVRKPS